MATNSTASESERVVAGTVLPTRALGVDPPIVHYERRRPEESVLYQTLARDLESFVSDAERVLPYFVKRELRDFLG